MSEYESALCGIIHILSAAVTDPGRREMLVEQLTTLRNDFTTMGSESGASVIDFLIQDISSPTRTYRPAPPHLRLVRDKDEDSN